MALTGIDCCQKLLNILSASKWMGYQFVYLMLKNIHLPILRILKIIGNDLPSTLVTLHTIFDNKHLYRVFKGYPDHNYFQSSGFKLIWVLSFGHNCGLDSPWAYCKLIHYSSCDNPANNQGAKRRKLNHDEEIKRIEMEEKLSDAEKEFHQKNILSGRSSIFL